MDLEINPEHSIRCKNEWELGLGMSINMCIHVITQQYQILKNVKFCYVKEKPLEKDIQIYLCDLNILLLFDAETQVLKLIRILSFEKVNLEYNNKIICDKEVAPTLAHLQHSIGVTRPIEHDEILDQYVLSFRGLSFQFPGKERRNNDLMTAQSLSIYFGANRLAPETPTLPLAFYYNHCYPDLVELVRDGARTLGIKIRLKSEVDNRKNCLRIPSKGSSKSQNEMLGLKMFERIILFGESDQSVLSKLGHPTRVYYKEEDKMQIHSPKKNKNLQVSDYFYNYFTLGLDLLFDANGVVKKVILHTNMIGCQDFGVYHQCPFRLELPKHVELSPHTQWSDVRDKLVQSSAQCIMYLRKEFFDHSHSDYFKNYYFYNYQDLIFEVMRNDHLASVIIFNTGPPLS